jgi:putative transcription factor
MGVCDLCGKNEQLFKTAIEGTELSVCRSCASYGVNSPTLKKSVSKKENSYELPIELREQSYELKPNYFQIVKEARERRSIMQEDFAKKIQEKLSVIRKIESGAYEPPIELARRLEKALGVRIIEKVSSGDITKISNRTTSMTIGDLLHKK